jgi:hypothetical protein
MTWTFTEAERRLHGDIAKAWSSFGPFEVEGLGVFLRHEEPEMYAALLGRRPLEVEREWGGWMEFGCPMIYAEPPAALACLGIYMLAALECRDLRRQTDFFLLDQGMRAHLQCRLTNRDFLQLAGGGLNEEQRQVLARFMQAALEDTELLGLEPKEVEMFREAVAQWG